MWHASRLCTVNTGHREGRLIGGLIYIFFLLGVTPWNAVRAQESGREPAREAMSVRLDTWVPVTGSTPPGDEWTVTLTAPGRRYLRVQFADIRDTGSDDYEVVLFASNLTRIVTYTKAEFSGRATFW